MALATALVLPFAAGTSAFAQESDYPSRTVTVVAPSAPGGLFSLFARLVGDQLEQELNATVVVENRPGAASAVGATYVQRAPHDGYTLMIAASSALAINPTLRKSLPYDPDGFVPIALIARVPQVLVVDSSLPIKSIDDLVKFAKSKPGGLSYATAGHGTAQHLDAEMLKNALDIPMTHVPHKGMMPALSSVAGGHVPMMFAVIPPSRSLVDAGKLRQLAVTTAERIEMLPDVPTMAELGFKGFDAATWFMLVAPTGTPQVVVDKIYGAMRELTNAPGTRQKLVNLGLMPVKSPPPEQLKTFVASERERFRKILEQAGLAGSQ